MKLTPRNAGLRVECFELATARGEKIGIVERGYFARRNHAAKLQPDAARLDEADDGLSQGASAA